MTNASAAPDEKPAGAAAAAGSAGPAEAGAGLWRCDFCGAAAPRVRRIALDAGYDRLQTPHRERYACPDCSAAKERERRGDV